MRIIPYKLTVKSLLVLFALLIFSTLVFRPVQQTIAARIEPRVPAAQEPKVGFGIPDFSGKKKMEKLKIVANVLAKVGPVIPAVYNMSNFAVQGLVKGDGWMIAIEYELEAGSAAQVTISVKDVKQAFVIQLPSTNGQRAEVVNQLPEIFGKKPQVGVFSFRAFKTGLHHRGQEKPASFFLYGLAVGRKGVAVGSILVDQLKFQPGSIRPKLKEKAAYSFRSLSDFDTASAEFFVLKDDADGVFRPQLVNRKAIKSGVRRNESVTSDWDGKNSDGKISQGSHQFHVRVWRGLKSGGDWISVATKQRVKVE